MLKQRFLQYLPRHRSNRLLRRLDRICVRIHQAYENLDYDFYENGENFVLQKLKRHADAETIFDVGANVGDWANMAAETMQDAKIYSFEIVPDTFEKLRSKCARRPNILPFALGLSDVPGEIDVYFSSERSANATCVEGISELFHKYRPPRVQAEVTTGDLFCATHGVQRIDFLKLDVEGFEPRVLKGFEQCLKAGTIKAIQFEYGYVNIVVKYLLKDFYDLLVPCGMRIGKIYPTYVDFRDYELQDENFLGPNYLAVHSSMESLLRELRG